MNRGIIWLICEDESDAPVIQNLLKAHGYEVTVKELPPTGGRGGISRLAAQIDRLIATARAKVAGNPNACFAVFHDADQQTEAHKQHQEKIEQVCKFEGVKRIVAFDELEAWLLADTGVCKWLGCEPGNHDSLRKPSDRLDTYLKKAGKGKLDSRSRLNASKQASGDSRSPSLKKELKHLDGAPCVRPSSA